MATKPNPITVDRVDAAVAQLTGQHVDAPMQAQQEAISEAANVDSITDIIRAIGAEMNTEKAKLAVALLNVTSYAVGLQGRSAWNTRDFMSFGVALAALAQIDSGEAERDMFAPSKHLSRPRHEPDMSELERVIRGG